MIQILTKEEERILLQTILDELRISEGRKRAQVLRDLVLILLGLRCGLRVGEVQRLRVSHVWFQNHPVTSIHIPANFNKGCVEAWVRVVDDLHEALKQYVPVRLEYAHADEEDPLLLISEIGRKARNPVLSRPVVSLILERWRLKAGIRHFKYHACRHTMASRILSEGGGNIRVVQQLLRHRSISSTAIYTHPGQDELDVAMMKTFNGVAKPLEGKL
jgi:site-specific recombinase XerD